MAVSFLEAQVFYLSTAHESTFLAHYFNLRPLPTIDAFPSQEIDICLIVAFAETRKRKKQCSPRGQDHPQGGDRHTGGPFRPHRDHCDPEGQCNEPLGLLSAPL